jgi:hypothetical protein
MPSITGAAFAAKVIGITTLTEAKAVVAVSLTIFDPGTSAEMALVTPEE